MPTTNELEATATWFGQAWAATTVHQLHHAASSVGLDLLASILAIILAHVAGGTP